MKTGKHMLGRKLSVETCKKLSIAKKGKMPKNFWMLHTPQVVKKQAAVRLGKTHSEEWRKNISISKTKDVSQLKNPEDRRINIMYLNWSRDVKDRDNWKCKIADSNCRGHLESHHILNWKDYPELRYDVNNGITLCVGHHPRGRKREEQLSPYFQDLIINTTI